MPYKSNRDIDPDVRVKLPTHAQDIYREAFNSAYDQYDQPNERRGNDTREETAHKVAWAAVKNSYQKDEATGKWIAKKGTRDHS